jgi:hypothetical protein
LFILLQKLFTESAGSQCANILCFCFAPSGSKRAKTPHEASSRKPDIVFPNLCHQNLAGEPVRRALCHNGMNFEYRLFSNASDEVLPLTTVLLTSVRGLAAGNLA